MINHNCEISNTAALSEVTEPISSASDSPSTSNISQPKDLSKPINSKYDIGLFVSILNNVWTPDPNFIFPTQSCAKFKRQLQIKWLNTFKWLAYSKCKEGVFCKYYVFFLNQNQVGKGSHESLALETFRCHANYSYHHTAVLNSDNIIAILNNKQDNVLVQLNNQLKEDILQNRNMLNPIIQTIRLCGRQQFGLREHQDSGHNTLKKYLETCSSNAMYTKQFSIYIRYFEEELVVLLKDFLTFVPVHDVTGLGLATVLLNTLKELGLDLDKLRRHGYDGAASMSEYLQTKNIDLVNAPDRVNQVTIQLKILRDNATNEFNKIYEEVNRLGGLINVEESMPRICDSQRNRQNVPFQNTQEFYRRTVFIPHLNGIHLSLDKRILSHHEIINSRQFVLPNMIVDKPYSNLKTTVTFYQNDFKGYDDIIEDEYQLWQSKWNLYSLFGLSHGRCIFNGWNVGTRKNNRVESFLIVPLSDSFMTDPSLRVVTIIKTEKGEKKAYESMRSALNLPGLSVDDIKTKIKTSVKSSEQPTSQVINDINDEQPTVIDEPQSEISTVENEIVTVAEKSNITRPRKSANKRCYSQIGQIENSINKFQAISNSCKEDDDEFVLFAKSIAVQLNKNATR
ncbi:hypothetical protein QTP88_025132 [Uroleucon formosanum]